MTAVGVRIIPEPAPQEHRTTRHAICAYFSLQKIIFVVSFRKKSVRGGVVKRAIPLLRQPIVTEVLLPRASSKTNKNYGLEVRQQYPGVYRGDLGLKLLSVAAGMERTPEIIMPKDGQLRDRVTDEVIGLS